MLRRVVGHFPSGQLVIDGYSRLGRWLLRHYPPVRASGAELDWTIDDPRELEREVPGLVFDSEWWVGSIPGTERYESWLSRQVTRLSFHSATLRRLGRGLCYHFSPSA